MEYRFKHKNGQYVWLQDRFSILFDAAGRVSSRIGSVRDINELRRASDKLRYSENLIKSLINSTSDIIVFKDKDFIFRVVNPAMCQLVGEDEKELVGKTDFDIFPKELAETYQKDDREVVESGRAIIKDEKVSTPDGLRLVNTTKAPVFNDNNECIGIAIIVRDITERKRAEEMLQQSEARWRFALEGAGDGLWDWNAVSNRVFFSKRWKEMLGYTDNEIENDLKEWDSRIHPDDKSAAHSDLDRHFNGETPIYENEHRLLCKDGKYKWILDRGKVVEWTEDGKPLRVIGTHGDISERKEAEAERLTLITDLKEALSQVKKLSGLLPICSYCKKIRDDQGYWTQIESYIHEHSEADFSHSICNECAKKYYPDMDIYEE